MKSNRLHIAVGSALLTAILCLVCPLMRGQAPNLIVSQLPGTDQLPVNEVTAIMQDADGYMWYGTSDGLCRFDGYNVKVFRSDFNSPGFIARNLINYIADGGERYVWYSTERGVYILDKLTYTNRVLSIDDFVDSFYSLIATTSDGSVWVGGSSRLYRFQPDGTLIKSYALKAGVASFYVDHGGNLFVGVYGDALYVIKAGGDRLQMVRQGFVPTCMTESWQRDGHYWVCEDGLFLMTFNPQQPQKEATFEAIPNPKNSRGSDITFFTRIEQDDVTHSLWLLSYYRGLIRLDAHGHQLSLPERVEQRNSFAMNTLYKDHDGNLWMSGFNTGGSVIGWPHNGLNEVDMSGLKLTSALKPTVMRFVRDSEGVYWIFQNRNGLYLYDPAKHQSSYHYDYPSIEAIPFYQISDLTLAADRRSVLVSYYGNRFARMHRNGMDFVLDYEVNLSDYGYASLAINSIREVAGKILIAATYGLYSYNPATNEVKPTKLTEGDISTVVPDGTDGSVWVGLREDGLNHLDAKGRLKSYLPGVDITSCAVSDASHLWIATGQGEVMLFNTDDSSVENFSTACGLNGDAVNDLIVDSNHHLWIVSNQQMAEFNPENRALRIYSASVNSMQRFLPHSVFLDRQTERLYVGGIPGIVYHNLKKEDTQTQATQRTVRISDVRVANHSVWFDSLRHSTDNYIELSPDDQNIEISFSSLDIMQAASARYAYRLLGLSDDWIYLSAGKNEATYSNLPKGTYRFQVMCADENGLWNDNITELTIHRLPAWYESTIAYIVYALLLIALILYVAYAYRQRVRQNNEKQLAEQLVQTKLRYFTNISHELLTPLAVISSINDSMAPVDDVQANKVSLIRSNILRLKHLLQQILDFRKVETQNIKLYVEQGNLSQFIERQCRESFIPLAQNKDIKLGIEKPLQDITGYFDTDKIEKVMFNLVSNAIKYSQSQQRVTIKLDTVDGSTAVISVEDEGIGIDSREISKIFSRFYSSKNKQTGVESNGIGLSLTKDLIELHHGSISVSSQRGHGSTFTIRFPLTRSAYTALEVRDKNQEEQIDLLKNEITRMQTEQHPETELSLLIVEDNVDMLTALQEILSKKYYIHTATNGREALDVMQEHPDLQFVVSDISMPLMNGIALCREIKANINTSHVIVVMLTAMISTENQVDSYNAGADAYLPKPFESRVLLALLGNLWTQRQRRQEQFRTTPSEQAASTLELSELDQQFVNRAIQIIMDNMSEPKLDVEFLASELCMSRSTFSRKIRALTGDTPLEFIKSIKLKHAYKLLQRHSMSVIEVVEAIGYNDRNNFTQSFKEAFGVLPSKV